MGGGGNTSGEYSGIFAASENGNNSFTSLGLFEIEKKT